MRFAICCLPAFLLALVAEDGFAQSALDRSMAACERRGGEQPGAAILACGRVIRTGDATPAQRARAHGLRAVARLDAGDGSSLVDEDLDTAIRLGERSVPIFLERAARRLNSSLASDVDVALADYEAALALQPGHPQALSGRATIRMRRGDNAGARADYDAALAADPQDIATLFARSVLLSTLGEDEQARRDLTDVIRRNPRFWQAYSERGGILLRSGELRPALADFDAAVRHHPGGGNAPVLTLRCATRHRLGNSEGAASDCRLALERSAGQWAPALLMLSGFALLRGDLEEARRQAEASLTRSPGYPAALALRGRIKARSSDAAGADADLAAAGEPGRRRLIMFFGTDFGEITR